jgi:hypothetical protein
MNTRFIIILFIAAAIGLSSCKNNDNVFTTKASAFYKIINASSDTLNYYLNGTRQNNGSSMVPGGATFYLAVPEGSENFQFKKNGATDVLFSVPEKLVADTNYSLYITGPSINQTFKTTDILIPDTSKTTDTLTKARFVHASSDIGNLDVYIGDTLKYTNRQFTSTSNFIIFGKGNKRVRVYLAGTTTLEKDTSFVMTDHAIYTIYTYGLKAGKGASKFNVAFTLNYQN